jgi:hypothetical protein
VAGEDNSIERQFNKLVGSEDFNKKYLEEGATTQLKDKSDLLDSKNS